MGMKDLVPKRTNTEIVPLIERALKGVREDMQDNPYIQEALRVLPVRGYRSEIGAFWNAVVDDLRSKIIFRSVRLFNKEINVGRTVETYDDFQKYVNDDQLVELAHPLNDPHFRGISEIYTSSLEGQKQPGSENLKKTETSPAGSRENLREECKRLGGIDQALKEYKEGLEEHHKNLSEPKPSRSRFVIEASRKGE
jgi:hypothetical protein